MGGGLLGGEANFAINAVNGHTLSEVKIGFIAAGHAGLLNCIKTLWTRVPTSLITEVTRV